MASIIFRVPLICSNCGSLNDERSNQLATASIGLGTIHEFVSPGDVLDLEVGDFADGYFTLRQPSNDDTRVIALELWGCVVCARVQAARLRFERIDATHWRFSAALDEAHFISRRLEEWAPNRGDDADRVRALVSHFGATS